MADLPIGTILIYPAKNVPEGFLPCDGRKVSKRAYPELYALIHTTFGETSNEFYLPDLQGQFIRGWDKDGNIDPGRQFGKEQDDAFQGHAHKFCADAIKAKKDGDHKHNLWGFNYDLRDASINSINNWEKKLPKDAKGGYETGETSFGETTFTGDHSHDIVVDAGKQVVSVPIDSVYGSVRNKCSTETRPKNVALMFCIKVK